MKRANRLLQIEKLRRAVTISRYVALTSSQRPVALIKKYPAIVMTVSALLLGLLTRGAISTPLPAAMKILSIPLFRKLVAHAVVSYRRSIR
ncbi:MAG: hypothetical protein Q7W55_12170 [Pseudohongiella sp.]|nr:hypothetical protein [Pseudohongiella sp.]MDO9519435.1 hypothetical protein [Pseudohongiella sp.]MDP2127557.1 hypothetical protein [Pseudohongiella sp.]